MPTPIDTELYEQVKNHIRAIYKKPSAYASGAIVKEYKRLGGRYKEDDDPKTLRRWFKEKWININPVLGVNDKTAYPVYRPTKRITNETPTLLQDIPIDRLKQQYKLKQKYQGNKNLPSFI
jgi:hypothetical protein